MEKVKAFLTKVKDLLDKIIIQPIDRIKEKISNHKTTQTLKQKITNKRREHLVGFAFIFVWIVGYAIFTLYPVFYSLYLSFFKVRMDGGNLNLDFEGINNYRAVFLSDPYFVSILGEYAVEMVINVS
ncbi:hypothetical protein, partial [Methanocalculus natronophilus]|uniref:hypothetical protein n=1 Tax=Methanocalculus natronophilus TaxID=1262400 RepID=UPI0031B5F368